MRAQLLHAWGGEVSESEVPVPRPGPGEALVRMEACGVGLTVLNAMRGDLGNRPEDLPRVPGHEAIGVVVERGPDVETPDLGERVMAYTYLTCGVCDPCRRTWEPLCRNYRGFVGVATDGGYAEYVALPAANLLPVPAGIAPVEATTIPDAVATSFHVCRRARVGPEDTVLVIGAAGGVGIHMVQMARLFGADVIAVDLGDDKLQATRDAGAGAALDFRSGERDDGLRSLAPSGVSVAIDLVGSPEAFGFCLGALGPRGRLVVLTTFPGVGVEVSPRRVVFGEIEILGSRYASRWEVLEAARLVAQRRIRPVVSAAVPLSEVRTVHARLRDRTLVGRGAIRF